MANRRIWLDEQTYASCEVDRVSCALAPVARFAQPLNVSYVVRSATGESDYVIFMFSRLAQVCFAVRALVVLLLEESLSFLCRVRAVSTKLLCPSFFTQPSNFILVFCAVVFSFGAHLLSVSPIMVPSIRSVVLAISMLPCIIFICTLFLCDLQPRAVFLRLLAILTKLHFVAFGTCVSGHSARRHMPIHTRPASKIGFTTKSLGFFAFWDWFPYHVSPLQITRLAYSGK